MGNCASSHQGDRRAQKPSDTAHPLSDMVDGVGDKRAHELSDTKTLLTDFADTCFHGSSSKGSSISVATAAQAKAGGPGLIKEPPLDEVEREDHPVGADTPMIRDTLVDFASDFAAASGDNQTSTDAYTSRMTGKPCVHVARAIEGSGEIPNGIERGDLGSDNEPNQTVDTTCQPAAETSETCTSTGENGTLIGPFDHNFCSVSLEKRPELKLPRLDVISHKVAISNEAAEAALASLKKVLELRQPLTIMYDVRNLSLPPSSVIRIGINWVKTPAHTDLLDAHLQGIAVILSSRIVSGMVNWLLKIFNPPQPVRVVQSEQAALDFLRNNCQEERVWTTKKI